MTTHQFSQRSFLTMLGMAALLVPRLAAQPAQAPYFPPGGTWQHKAPADAGMDGEKLKQAVEWAEAHGSKWKTNDPVYSVAKSFL